LIAVPGCEIHVRAWRRCETSTIQSLRIERAGARASQSRSSVAKRYPRASGLGLRASCC
jgi:hypothetical protein